MTKIEGRKEDDLLRTYGFRGFPSMAILDASGEVITKKVNRDLPSMQSVVAAPSSYYKLKSKVEAGEQYDKTAWFTAQLGLGQLSVDEAKEQFEALGLKGAAAKKADQQILALEIDGILHSRGGNPIGKIYEFFKAGRIPPENSSQTAFYHSSLMQAALRNDDAKAFKFSYKRALSGAELNVKNWQNRLPRYERDLEKYKDNARILPQVERAIQAAKRQIETGKKSIAKIEAFAKKLEEKK